MAELPASEDGRRRNARKGKKAGKPPWSFKVAFEALQLASEFIKLVSRLLDLFGIS